MSRRKMLNSSVKVFHQKKFGFFLLVFFFDRTLMKIPKEISLNIKVHRKEKEIAGYFAQKDLAL